MDMDMAKFIRKRRERALVLRNVKRHQKRLDGIIRTFFSLHADEVVKRLEREREHEHGQEKHGACAQCASYHGRAWGELPIEQLWEQEAATIEIQRTEPSAALLSHLSDDEHEVFMDELQLYEAKAQLSHKRQVQKRFGTNPEYKQLMSKAVRVYQRTDTFHKTMDSLKEQLARAVDPWDRNRILDEMDFQRRNYHTF